jgi:hypothetical protein
MTHAAFSIRRSHRVRSASGTLAVRCSRDSFVAGYPFFSSANAMISEPFSEALVA